jgi:hypothetical protein
MRSVIAWFAENHVAANLLMIFLLLAGTITGLTMKVEVFPETDLDIIKVTTQYPGASPSEVEEAVLRRIEEKIAGLAGIKRIDSRAREGWGTVTIEIVKDWDQKKLLEEVKAEVDRITTLPDEAENPKFARLHGSAGLSMLPSTGMPTKKPLNIWPKESKTTSPICRASPWRNCTGFAKTRYPLKFQKPHYAVTGSLWARWPRPCEKPVWTCRQAALRQPVAKY